MPGEKLAQPDARLTREGADVSRKAALSNSVAELESRLVAAQQATEQEYWKLRDVETRYRRLLDASAEAVLTVGAEDLRVIEANPAAMRSLHTAPGRDVGRA